MPAKQSHTTLPDQLTFDWPSAESPRTQTEKVQLETGTSATESTEVSREVESLPPDRWIDDCKLRNPDLLQVLPWDFRTSFPLPTEDAIANGIVQEEDAGPENLKSLHDEHAQHALVLLHDLDAILDARRSGVDPHTGKPPRTARHREALDKLFQEEPPRLERAFDSLIDVYEEAFGAEAADAFRKAIRARYAGVEVITLNPPAPGPLPQAVADGVFGAEEDGTVVNPDSDEVRAIIENVADDLADLPAGAEREALLAKCREDFGAQATEEIERWARLKSEADSVESFDYDPGHPWHYLQRGDGAEPMSVDAIPARPTTLDQLGIKLPKNPAKNRALLEKMLTDQKRQLSEDKQRYQELIDRGTDALSTYDREIAHGGNDEMVLASAIALKFNHISGGRGRVQALANWVASKK